MELEIFLEKVRGLYDADYTYGFMLSDKVEDKDESFECSFDDFSKYFKYLRNECDVLLLQEQLMKMEATESLDKMVIFKIANDIVYGVRDIFELYTALRTMVIVGEEQRKFTNGIGSEYIYSVIDPLTLEFDEDDIKSRK